MTRLDGPPLPHDPRALPERRGDLGAGLGAGGRDAGTNLSGRERGGAGGRRDAEFRLALAAAAPSTARPGATGIVEGGPDEAGEARNGPDRDVPGQPGREAARLRQDGMAGQSGAPTPARAGASSPGDASSRTLEGERGTGGRQNLAEAGRDGAPPGAGDEPRILAIAHPQTAASVQTAAPASPAQAADIMSLAARIETELDAALKLSGRSVAGGIELTLSIQSTSLALTGLTVIARGGEISVALQLADGVPSGTLAAAAQELAAQLSQRFPRRTIRVEEAAERPAEAEPENSHAALAALFRR